MRTFIFAILVFIFMSGVSFAQDVKISRFYHYHGDFYRVVVMSDKNVRVSCAALDSQGNMLAVSVPLRVQPPAREIQITVPGATPVSARCWVVD